MRFSVIRKVNNMKDISKLKNYREKYKRYYGIEFGRDYEIHHIDLNHNNNDIDNLVLLPRELHRKYHFYLNAVRKIKNGESYMCMFDARVHGNLLNTNSYEMNAISNLVSVLNECSYWYDKKAKADMQKYFEESC